MIYCLREKLNNTIHQKFVVNKKNLENVLGSGDEISNDLMSIFPKEDFVKKINLPKVSSLAILRWYRIKHFKKLYLKV